MRRLLVGICIAVLVSASAACGSSDGKSSTTAAPGAGVTSAAPSAAVDVKANTAAVCGKLEDLVSAAKVQPLGTQIGSLIAAKTSKDAAAEAKAKTEIKALTEQLAKDLHALKAEALDPQLQAVLDKAAEAFTTLGTDAYLAKINTAADINTAKTDLVKAGLGVADFCP